jgi:hypothetical protein
VKAPRRDGAAKLEAQEDVIGVWPRIDAENALADAARVALAGSHYSASEKRAYPTARLLASHVALNAINRAAAQTEFAGPVAGSRISLNGTIGDAGRRQC